MIDRCASGHRLGHQIGFIGVGRLTERPAFERYVSAAGAQAPLENHLPAAGGLTIGPIANQSVPAVRTVALHLPAPPVPARQCVYALVLSQDACLTQVRSEWSASHGVEVAQREVVEASPEGGARAVAQWEGE